jgi:hypothetical protein
MSVLAVLTLHGLVCFIGGAIVGRALHGASIQLGYGGATWPVLVSLARYLWQTRKAVR